MIKRIGYRLFVTLLSMFYCLFAFADGDSDLFKYNQGKLDVNFQDMVQVESEFFENSQEFLINLSEHSNLQFATQPNDEDPSLSKGFEFRDIDLLAFGTGLCCPPVGFFIFAVNPNKSYEQKVSFWMGCATSGTFVIVSSVINN